MRVSGRSIGVLAAASTAMAVFLSAGSAQAADCLAAAFGGKLNCTANDFAVSSVTVTNVDLNDCGGGTNTFQFDGLLNVGSGSATRYDVGFYISNNASNADVGSSCAVSIIPAPNGATDDGDTCGDYGGLAGSFPVSDVTVTCQDSDGNGFFDFAICTAWDQNAGVNCSGPADAIPGTSSKCDCTFVNTDVQIPHCDTNGDCTPDANACTDAVCVGLGGPGADDFGCAQVNNTDPCDDGLFCNGPDTCSGGSCSGHAGDPCTGGGICGDNCNEAADNCFDLAGTPCRAAATVCDVAETCTGSTEDCPSDAFASTGVQCRAANGVCDVAENCTGTSSACPANTFAGTGVLCRGANGVCDVPENCSGTSASCPANGFAGTGTVCRADAGECDAAENCTGTSASCPADSGDPLGTPCTDDLDVCTDDECDGAGSCAHTNNTAVCDDGLFCTEGDQCSGGVCSGAPVACSDNIDCTDDFCNEETDSCDATENNANCDDLDACTSNVCSIAQNGCVFDYVCGQDICRSPGYWSTHSGTEKEGATNVTQELLDIVGPIEVCGEEISTTSNAEPLYMEGLGLTSAVEGLCMRTKGVKQRQLYRQLVAARLNCAISGASDCDEVTSKYIEVLWSDCSDVCAGNPPAMDPPTVNQCISQLDCFNNGGQVVEGTCAFGACESQPEIPCGGDAGSCPDYMDAPQDCVPFPGNCHSASLCNEGLYCPKKTPAASRRACREARANECTIDSCGI